MISPSIWLLCFSLFFCNNILSTLGGCRDDDSLYIIRNPHSGLVVDASNSIVTIQHFDGYTPQLWKFRVASRPGLFLIINNSTGQIMDFDKSNDHVILAEENGTLDQQWFINSNGRIVNAGANKNLDIPGAKYEAGRHLCVYSYSGIADNEHFVIKEKLTCCAEKCSKINPYK